MPAKIPQIMQKICRIVTAFLGRVGDIIVGILTVFCGECVV